MNPIPSLQPEPVSLHESGNRTGKLRWLGYSEQAIKEEMDRPTYFNMVKSNPEKARQRLVSLYGVTADLLIAQWTKTKK